MTARDALAAIRERAEAATKGPWGHWPEAGEIEIITSVEPGGNEPRRDMEIIASSVRPLDGWDAIYGRDERHVYRNGEPDAEFIAHARTDVPALVEALEAVLEIHREIDDGRGPHCFEDAENWPCPTVTAIETALEGR